MMLDPTATARRIELLEQRLAEALREIARYKAYIAHLGVADDLLWGIPEIAKAIGRSKRQTEYLIQQNVIPVTRLTPKIIVGSRRAIHRQLGGEIPDHQAQHEGKA